MKTYKQKNFKRDYEITNIKFIQTDLDVLNKEIWVECEYSEIDCELLYKEENLLRYGYL